MANYSCKNFLLSLMLRHSASVTDGQQTNNIRAIDTYGIAVAHQ